MTEKMIRCKVCGRLFSPQDKHEVFCSEICRTTGCFVSGGGDQSKPPTEGRKYRCPTKTDNLVVKPKRIRGGGEKYPRVTQMFSLPLNERKVLAKTFTKEEAEYSRRLAYKKLKAEWKWDDVINWEGEEEEKPNVSYEGIIGGRLGDSDDGTV